MSVYERLKIIHGMFSKLINNVIFFKSLLYIDFMEYFVTSIFLLPSQI